MFIWNEDTIEEMKKFFIRRKHLANFLLKAVNKAIENNIDVLDRTFQQKIIAQLVKHENDKETSGDEFHFGVGYFLGMLAALSSFTNYENTLMDKKNRTIH